MKRERRQQRRWAATCALCTLVSVLSACGGGGGGGTGVTTTTAGAAPAPGPAPAPVQPAPTVPPPATTPGPAPTTPAPTAPALQLPQSELFTTTTGRARQFALASGRIGVSAQKGGDGAEEVVLRSPEGNLTVVFDAATGSSVITDAAQGLVTVRETGPKGTLIRTYSSAGQFVSGYFIEGTGSSSRTLWRLLADGTTDPSNLTSPRPFRGARAAPRSQPEGQQLPMVDNCYNFMTELTSSGADFADEAGEALDQDDNGSAARRVGRGSRFLADLYRRIPRLCPDAPDPVSDSDFQKETVLEALRRAGPNGVRAVLDAYADFREYVSDLRDDARQLGDALRRLSESERRRLGAAAEGGASGLDVLSTDPLATLRERQAASQPALVYISGSVSCVSSEFGSGSLTLRNNCGNAVRAGWCFSGSSAGCTLTNQVDLGAGSVGRYSAPNGGYVFTAACPREYEGRPVVLNDTGLLTFSCSYRSR